MNTAECDGAVKEAMISRQMVFCNRTAFSSRIRPRISCRFVGCVLTVAKHRKSDS